MFGKTKGAVLPKNRNAAIHERRRENPEKTNGRSILAGSSKPLEEKTQDLPPGGEVIEDLLAVPPTQPSKPRGNPFRPNGVMGKVFDFLASLRLAVCLLTVMGLVCIAGTIAESNYTARLAQRLVYRTFWFDLLILAIFINVLFATLSRFPWRITQLGFLVTHLGVLTTLVGALISHRYGVEGQMMVSEGQTRDRIQLNTSFIGIQKEGDQVRHRFDAVEVEWGKPSPENPQVYEIPALGLKAIVTGFFPDSEWKEIWKDGGPMENPAIHFAIDNTTMGRMAEGWLAPKIPSNRSMNLGPATILAKWVPNEAALRAELAATPQSSTAELGILEIKLKGSSVTQRIDVAKAKMTPVPIEGTRYSIQVTDQMESGVINDSGVLANDPTQPPNPVVIYDVYQGDARILTRQIEYALFPDFDMMHNQEVESPFEATYRHEGSGPASGAEFVLLLGPEKNLTWKVTTSTGQVTSGPITLGQPVPMPMMTAGMNLLIDEYFSHAWREEQLVERPIKKGEFGSRAARMELVSSTGEKQQVWAQMFEDNEVTLDGQKYHIVYQNDELPLGFSIQLKDFRLLHYPGGEIRPMSYESDVKVTSLSGNESLIRDNITIMMNEPLDHGGYRIFQSSYIDQPPGDPRISIFSIAYDPGITIIYAGSIILCLGIAIMFYGKPYLRKLEQQWQAKKVEVPAT